MNSSVTLTQRDMREECCAAQKNHVDIVKKLVLNYKCEVMAKNINGSTSQVMAADKDGDTPVHIAAMGGSLSTVCTLIDEFKCDPNKKGFEGKIPLHYAAQRNHVDIVRKLVRHFVIVWLEIEMVALLFTLLHWKGHCLQCAH